MINKFIRVCCIAYSEKRIKNHGKKGIKLMKTYV